MGEYSKSAIIKYARIATGMTQEELAETICDPVTLSRYESGKIDPTNDKFLRLMRKMGETGDIYHFPIESNAPELEKQMSELLYAIEQQDWKTVSKIKELISLNKSFSLDYPENRQYLKRIDVITKYNMGEMDINTSILELTKAWKYTFPQHCPHDFPLNRILRETEILILFNLATFYKLAQNYENSLALYERLDIYFDRKDMNNDYKPNYLIYIGYSNILGEIGRYDDSVEICFKAINKLLMNNQANYLYNFYYNIGWNLIRQVNIKIEDPKIKEAKLYVWLAYQLCKQYPEDKKNLHRIKELYEQIS